MSHPDPVLAPAPRRSRAAWPLGRLAGIRLQVHWTFLLLLAWVAVEAAARGAGPRGIAAAIGLVLAVFACVVLHELGHALVARRFGVATRDIMLLPIGGVARLERMPDRPREELAIALAGPAVTLAIAVVLYAILRLAGGVPPFSEAALLHGSLLVQLLWVNVTLLAFNVLPAFPMDGGRVLRALLALRLDYARATRIAAVTGQVMAVLFGIAGLYGNPVLLFIGVFVFFGAAMEAREAELKGALAGVTVGDAMMTRFGVLPPEATVGDAVRELLAGSQEDFPVVAGGVLQGVVLRRDLLRAARAGGARTAVTAVMRADLPVMHEDDALDDAMRRMQAADAPTLPVTRADRLVGLLTLANQGERLALGAPSASAGGEVRGERG